MASYALYKVWSVMSCVLILLCLLVCSSAVVQVEAATEGKALRMIIVDDRQTADDLVQKLRSGASFSALAHNWSRGPEQRGWGYSGLVRLEEVQEELRPKLAKLKEGQVSEVLQAGRRFIIVKAISPKIEQHFQAASRAQESNQLPQAVRELQAALRLEEDNVQTHIRLGMIHETAKQFDEAIRSLEKAQQYAPEEVQITLLRGAAYTHAATEKKDSALAQKALQAYQDALQRGPQLSAAAHFGLGKVYLTILQQPQTAVEHLEKAAASMPRVAEVHLLLVQAYYDTQRYEQGWQQLRTAQSLGYDFPKLREALQKVKQQSQR